MKKKKYIPPAIFVEAQSEIRGIGICESGAKPNGTCANGSIAGVYDSQRGILGTCMTGGTILDSPTSCRSGSLPMV